MHSQTLLSTPAQMPLTGLKAWQVKGHCTLPQGGQDAGAALGANVGGKRGSGGGDGGIGLVGGG